MIRLRAISKTYGTFTALEEGDYHFAREKTTALIGPSGSGKSTLLRLINGLIRPSSGTVLVDELELTREKLRDFRHRIGYVIQEGGLFPHMTARENVTLLARHLKRPLEFQNKRLQELAQLTHLDPELLERPPGRLSGGQRQRVSLMRALFLDPDVLLLDEPLGALDPMIRHQLQGDLREIFQTLKKTVVLVTHDMSEAAYLADEIMLLNQGRLIQQGKFTELHRNPSAPFVAEFIAARRDLPEAK